MLSRAPPTLVEPFHAMDDVLEVDFRFFHLLLEGSPLACAGNEESGEKHKGGGQDRGPEGFVSQQHLITKGCQYEQSQCYAHHKA